jgi:hypothetical protein
VNSFPDDLPLFHLLLVFPATSAMPARMNVVSNIFKKLKIFNLPKIR